MPRSLPLAHAAGEASATSMIAATGAWRPHPSASRTRRPTAASFSAGDSRHQHQHMLAFEQQLDALVGATEATGHEQRPEQFCSIEMEQLIRGSLERSVSTSSFAGSQSGASESTKSNLRVNAGNKITGRRHRTPRRFVVTDIPDFEEFNRVSPRKNGHSNDEGRRNFAAAQPRQGKTEVKGRFTIIDLSPESPLGSPRAQQSAATEGSSRYSARHGASPRRRTHRKNARSELPTLPSRLPQVQVMHPDPVDSSPRKRRVDLNVFDHHLDYLQKESVGMKSLLEGMVSTNARWIDALNQAGVVFLNDQANHRSIHSTGAAAVLPIEQPEPSPVFKSTTEEKLAAIKFAYMELQFKHESLLARNKQLEEQNEKLLFRLQEQPKNAFDNPQAQLQPPSDSKPSDGRVSDLTPMIGDADNQGVKEFSTDKDNQFDTEKHGHYWRRKQLSGEEECTSDTTSDGSVSKSPASAVPPRAELEYRNFVKTLESKCYFCCVM